MQDQKGFTMKTITFNYGTCDEAQIIFDDEACREDCSQEEPEGIKYEEYEEQAIYDEITRYLRKKHGKLVAKSTAVYNVQTN